MLLRGHRTLNVLIASLETAMAKIDVTVRYKPNQEQELSLVGRKTVAETVCELVSRLQLPDFDRQRRIRYGLYLSQEVNPVDDNAVIEDVCRSGDTLLLADVQNPWWRTQREPERDSYPFHPDSDATRIIGPSKPSSPTQHICQLRIWNGATVSISEEVIVNRQFILDHLSWLERSKLELGLSDRIERVSRKRHCKIFTQRGQWYMKAYHTVYLDGQRYRESQVAPLPHHARMMIGKDGWPIEVQLLPTGGTFNA